MTSAVAHKCHDVRGRASAVSNGGQGFTGTDHLSKIVFFQSTALPLGLVVVLVFLAVDGIDGFKVTWFVGVGATADAGSGGIAGLKAAVNELGVTTIPAAPSPITTNGAQYAGCAW